jgi:hypothetical protein
MVGRRRAHHDLLGGQHLEILDQRALGLGVTRPADKHLTCCKRNAIDVSNGGAHSAQCHPERVSVNKFDHACMALVCACRRGQQSGQRYALTLSCTNSTLDLTDECGFIARGQTGVVACRVRKQLDVLGHQPLARWLPAAAKEEESAYLKVLSGLMCSVYVTQLIGLTGWFA